MMKKILILLLLMVSTNIFAEWTRVAGSADGDMTVYVDYETIKKKGNKVKMWSMYDFKTIQQPGNLLSLLGRGEYDCEEETILTLEANGYSGNLANGDVVYTHSPSEHIKDKPTSPPPGTMLLTLVNIACSKK